MGEISEKAREKVSGPSWDAMRPKFDDMTDTLLSVDADAFADITTIYIKFTISNQATSPVYAVMWVKSSKRLVVGLALPEDDVPDDLGKAPKGMSYKGLTGYFTVEQEDDIPSSLAEWATNAFNFVASKN